MQGKLLAALLSSLFRGATTVNEMQARMQWETANCRHFNSQMTDKKHIWNFMLACRSGDLTAVCSTFTNVCSILDHNDKADAVMTAAEQGHSAFSGRSPSFRTDGKDAVFDPAEHACCSLAIASCGCCLHVRAPAAQPCPALPCPALPCPALPCPALPCPPCPTAATTAFQTVLLRGLCARWQHLLSLPHWL